MNEPQNRDHPRGTGTLAPRQDVPLWQSVCYTATAGGFAWGIRGQYGHETGAMLAGLMTGQVLALLYCFRANSLAAARMIALGTVAMGFGGSETYGQTIGLTQNPSLVGNWAALRWGLLGLAIKGGLWIGFAGTFFGIGWGGQNYHPRELYRVILVLIGLSFLGTWLINEPFHPEQRELPAIYFSADWDWEPEATLKPRREIWGGLLVAFLGLMFHVRAMRQDRLAWSMGWWGFLGGALGFPLGQSLQAFHAWNPVHFGSEFWLQRDPLINWWNLMETTFGLIMGGILGLGAWANQKHIPIAPKTLQISLTPGVETLLLVMHVVLLSVSEFDLIPHLGWVYDFGLIMGLIPLIGVSGGRWWPYGLTLPITAIPLAGKTFRHLTIEESLVSPWLGSVLFLAVPLILTGAAAWIFARHFDRDNDRLDFLPRCLLLTTWLYFGLNFAFFHFPWPWSPWTRRTPNGLIFLACAIVLTFLAFQKWREAIQMSIDK